MSVDIAESKLYVFETKDKVCHVSAKNMTIAIKIFEAHFGIPESEIVEFHTKHMIVSSLESEHNMYVHTFLDDEFGE